VVGSVDSCSRGRGGLGPRLSDKARAKSDWTRGKKEQKKREAKRWVFLWSETPNPITRLRYGGAEGWKRTLKWGFQDPPPFFLKFLFTLQMIQKLPVYFFSSSFSPSDGYYIYYRHAGIKWHKPPDETLRRPKKFKSKEPRMHPNANPSAKPK